MHPARKLLSVQPFISAVLLLIVGMAHADAPPAHRIAPGPVEVKLTFTDAKGAKQPLQGAVVHLGARFAVTDWQGVAVLDGVPPGRYPLVVAHTGYDRLEQQVTLAQGERKPIALHLQPSTFITVTGKTVLKGDDRPLPGVQVTLTPLKVSSVIHGRSRFASGWDGDFKLFSVPVGTYRAELTAPGCEPLAADVEIAPKMKPLTFAMSRVMRPAALRVSVLDAVTGEAVPKAKIELAEAWPSGMIARAETDAQGRAAIQKIALADINWADEKDATAAARRACTVYAEAQGYKPATVYISLSPDAAATLRLMPDKHTIAEREPNSAVAAAQEIPVGASVRLAITENTDVDWFRFRLTHPSHVRVSISDKPSIQTDLALLDRQGKTLAHRHEYTGKQNAVSADVDAGEYFVRVREWGQNGASDDPFTVVVDAVPAPDPQEPNDSAASATLIRPGQEMRGCIFPSGDRDYYRFDMARPGIVRLLGIGPIATEIRLMDEAGTLIARATQYANRQAAVTRELKPGRYYVAFCEWGDNGCSTKPYRLRLDAILDDGVDDPAQESSRLRAVRTMQLNEIVSSTILPSGDFDTWALALPSAGRIQLWMVGSTHMELALLSDQGKQLHRQTEYPGRTGRLEWETAGPTMVYVGVREWGDNGWSPSPYRVYAHWEPADEVDVIAHNDTPRTATPFEIRDVLRGNIQPRSDRDCFRFLVDKPGEVVFRGSGATSLTLGILDARGNSLAGVSDYPRRLTEVRSRVLPGEYFLLVSEWGDNEAAVMPWHIDSTFTYAHPDESVPLRNDPIRRLMLGQARQYAIEFVKDRDRFVFDAATEGEYQLWVRFGPATTVRLYDDRTNKLLADRTDYPGREIRVDLKPEGPTRYRAELFEWGDNDASWTPGYILFDNKKRRAAAVDLKIDHDPLDPTRVEVAATKVGWSPAVESVRVDADSDGTFDLTVKADGKPGAYRYRTEGVHALTALVSAADGTTTVQRMWVPAVGPRERKGVYVGVDFPGEGQVVEESRPCSVRAMSYTGARIRTVTCRVDDRQTAIAYSRPYELDIPWSQLDAGPHKLSITAVDASGESQTVERTFSVSDYFDLQPADEAVVTGTHVPVSWTGHRFGSARLRYRKRGEEGWESLIGQNARRRRILLSGLEPGVAYEFQPLGGAEPGPVRSVTRVKGLAFGRPRYGAAIKRDYDQRLGISVRNHAEKPMTVRLACGEPVDSKLLVGFVGEGSKGVPFSLQPGEEREFWLGMAAQDVVREVHSFPIRIVSEQGYSDEAEVEIRVRLPKVKFEWEDKGPLKDRLGQAFRLVNRGDTLTDFRLSTDTDALDASPSIDHGVFLAGQAMDIVVKPRLYEGFQSARGSVVVGALAEDQRREVEIALPEGKRIFGVNLIPGVGQGESSLEQTMLAARLLAGRYLNPDSVDWSRKTRPTDTDGDGTVDRWEVDNRADRILWVGDDTDGDGKIDFVHADIGYDGQFDYSAFKTDEGWDATNLVEAWLEMGFSLPWARAAYEKHGVDIVMNGTVIGRLRDAIPEGNYAFRIPPSVIRFGDDGSPAPARIEIRSQHLRGGHYVVNSDFRIKMRLTGTRVWTVADSAEAARKTVRDIDGLSMDAPDYSVSSSDLRIDGPSTLKKGSRIKVNAVVRNLGATRSPSLGVALLRSVPGGKGVELSRIYLNDLPLTGPVTVNLPWTAAAGTHQLRVLVDPDEETGDKNRANNEALITLSVPGDDAPPKLELREPADGAKIEGTVFSIAATATDDSAVARADVRIDNGLWQPLTLSGDAVTGRGLLQPGRHTVEVRVIDSGGNAVSQKAKVTAEAPLPEGEFISPAEGAVIDVRELDVRIRCPEARLVALRLNGGPWIAVPVRDGIGAARVELPFGAVRIEARIAGANGAARTVTRNVRCTAQPQEKPEEEKEKPEKPAEPKPDDPQQPEAPEQPQPEPADGTVDVPGVGPVNVLENPNGVAPPASTGRAAGRRPVRNDDDAPEAPQPADDDDAPQDGDDADEDDAAEAAQEDAAPEGPKEAKAPKAPKAPQQPQTAERPRTPQRPTGPVPRDRTRSVPQPRSRRRGPAGGFVSIQRRKKDWYCTNRPKIGFGFNLPDELKRKLKNLPDPTSAEYKKMVGDLLNGLKKRGVDTSRLERFYQTLIKRCRNLEADDELPGWLESWGLVDGGRTPEQQAELSDWRLAQEKRMRAWWLALLSSQDPDLIKQGLMANAKSIARFDAAAADHSQACIIEMQAHQRAAEDAISVLPVVGDAADMIAAVTGESLSGEQLSAYDRLFRAAGVLGPLGLEQLFKRSKRAQKALAAVMEKTTQMGRAGKLKLCAKLGIDPRKLDDTLGAIGQALTKERHIFATKMDDAARQAKRAYAASAEGADELRRWKQVQKQSQKSVDELGDLVRAGKGESDEFMEKVLQLQKDKTAQTLINDAGKVDDKVRQAVQKKLDELYDNVDDGVKKRLKGKMQDREFLERIAREEGIKNPKAVEHFIKKSDPDAIRLRYEQQHGVKLKHVEVEPMKVTNAPDGDMTKIGRDRDVTYRLVGTTEDGKKIVIGDVDHRIAEKIHNEELWKATKGELPDMKDPTMRDKILKINAEELDQTVTSKWHPEAFNVGEAELDDFLSKDLTPTLTRPEDIRDTVITKSDHWFHQADKALDPVQKSKNMAEGMRQARKQYDKLVMKRVKQYGLDPATHVPERLRKAMDIFEQVEDLKISPKQAEAMLAELGKASGAAGETSARTVVNDLASYLETLEKGPGKNFRQLKTAQLADDLAQVNNPQKALDMINDAFRHNEIDGSSLRKLREGKLTLPKDASQIQRERFADWAANAWKKGLLSPGERRLIETQLGRRLVQEDK